MQVLDMRGPHSTSIAETYKWTEAAQATGLTVLLIRLIRSRELDGYLGNW